MDRLIELINEVLEEIHLRGAMQECTVYIINQDGQYLISDFSIFPEKILYMDEIRVKATLFELLSELIMHDYERHGKEITRYATIMKSLRQINSKSIVAFAKTYNIPRRTIECWESGTKPDLLRFLNIANQCGISQNIVIRALDGLASLI